MTSSLINVIEYYNGPIITTKHGSTFVSGSLKIIQLDNRMSLDALKKQLETRLVYQMVKWSWIYIFDVMYHLLVIVFSTGHTY